MAKQAKVSGTVAEGGARSSGDGPSRAAETPGLGGEDILGHAPATGQGVFTRESFPDESSGARSTEAAAEVKKMEGGKSAIGPKKNGGRSYRSPSVQTRELGVHGQEDTHGGKSRGVGLRSSMGKFWNATVTAGLVVGAVAMTSVLWSYGAADIGILASAVILGQRFFHGNKMRRVEKRMHAETENRVAARTKEYDQELTRLNGQVTDKDATILEKEGWIATLTQENTTLNNSLGEEVKKVRKREEVIESFRGDLEQEKRARTEDVEKLSGELSTARASAEEAKKANQDLAKLVDVQAGRLRDFERLFARMKAVSQGAEQEAGEELTKLRKDLAAEQKSNELLHSLLLTQAEAIRILEERLRAAGIPSEEKKDAADSGTRAGGDAEAPLRRISADPGYAEAIKLNVIQVKREYPDSPERQVQAIAGLLVTFCMSAATNEEAAWMTPQALREPAMQVARDILEINPERERLAILKQSARDTLMRAPGEDGIDLFALARDVLERNSSARGSEKKDLIAGKLLSSWVVANRLAQNQGHEEPYVATKEMADIYAGEILRALATRESTRSAGRSQEQ